MGQTEQSRITQLIAETIEREFPPNGDSERIRAVFSALVLAAATFYAKAGCDRGDDSEFILSLYEAGGEAIQDEAKRMDSQRN